MPKGNAQICIPSSQSWWDFLFFFVQQKIPLHNSGALQRFHLDPASGVVDMYVNTWRTGQNFSRTDAQAFIWKSSHLNFLSWKLCACQPACGRNFPWRETLCSSLRAANTSLPIIFKKLKALCQTCRRNSLTCCKINCLEEIEAAVH